MNVGGWASRAAAALQKFSWAGVIRAYERLWGKGGDKAGGRADPRAFPEVERTGLY